MAAYRAAKLHIFDRQTSHDFSVVNAAEDLPPLSAQRLSFTAAPGLEADLTLGNDEMIFYRGKPLLAMKETHLRGRHNAENIMAAMGAGICLGADLEKMIPGARTYLPPSHRCEFIFEAGGVIWINDSKSTNLNALTQAVAGQAGRVILIAGGKNKGFDFKPLASLVKDRVTQAILIGEMRHAIAADWAGSVPCHPVDSLEEAVAKAALLAKSGDTVLFSPGTSSFDMFRSYEERGEHFKLLTRQFQITK